MFRQMNKYVSPKSKYFPNGCLKPLKEESKSPKGQKCLTLPPQAITKNKTINVNHFSKPIQKTLKHKHSNSKYLLNQQKNKNEQGQYYASYCQYDQSRQENKKYEKDEKLSKSSESYQSEGLKSLRIKKEKEKGLLTQPISQKQQQMTLSSPPSRHDFRSNYQSPLPKSYYKYQKSSKPIQIIDIESINEDKYLQNQQKPSLDNNLKLNRINSHPCDEGYSESLRLEKDKKQFFEEVKKKNYRCQQSKNNFVKIFLKTQNKPEFLSPKISTYHIPNNKISQNKTKPQKSKTNYNLNWENAKSNQCPPDITLKTIDSQVLNFEKMKIFSKQKIQFKREMAQIRGNEGLKQKKFIPKAKKKVNNALEGSVQVKAKEIKIQISASSNLQTNWKQQDKAQAISKQKNKGMLCFQEILKHTLEKKNNICNEAQLFKKPTEENSQKNSDRDHELVFNREEKFKMLMQKQQKHSLLRKEMEQMFNRVTLQAISVKENCKVNFILLRKLVEQKNTFVYLCVHCDSNSIFCLKRISFDKLMKQKGFASRESLINENKIQQWVEHPNIVSNYCTWYNHQSVYMMMEYMEQGTLLEEMRRVVLQQNQTHVDHKDIYPHKLQHIKVILMQLLKAVEYLHQLNIIHRDIKPANILITNNTYKISDFGSATYNNSQQYTGTLDYAAPEILEQRPYDQSIDMWSLGCMAYELEVGRPPFYNISRQQTIRLISRAEYNLQLVVNEYLQQMIGNLLKLNPKLRWSAQHALQSKFIQIDHDLSMFES